MRTRNTVLVATSVFTLAGAILFNSCRPADSEAEPFPGRDPIPCLNSPCLPAETAVPTAVSPSNPGAPQSGATTGTPEAEEPTPAPTGTVPKGPGDIAPNPTQNGATRPRAVQKAEGLQCDYLDMIRVPLT